MNCLIDLIKRFFKKSSIIDLEQIYQLQVGRNLEGIVKLLSNNKFDKSQLAEDYCVYLLEKYNGTFQRTQYGPLMVNREVVYYYNEFITKILLK